ncbi:type II toxin-antitoxin system VapC family toxin [Curtobacterium sp. MCBD17_035]|uniref:type II toxin-antitoxin system VapC family toxin n=1 Tax=Curtobacterium sp. MCBD17_035 TaxID=2175673 RepID=UPI000DA6FE1B|nr:type II toxin-antitoxin system VapC family toxin [Curtobacterium sp. MCBD17_035]WIB67312.1 type II toxin-antitoxin system VapC family toxin [Curtobacterium sp. MCBD17_035]
MTTAYLDTSAAMKLVVSEAESEALVAEISGSSRHLAASWLLHTELHCAAGRNPTNVGLDAVGQVLDAVTLVDVTRGDLLVAGTHAPLRSNDAIHLATALRLGVDEMITYDVELARAAADAGLVVTAPGSARP